MLLNLKGKSDAILVKIIRVLKQVSSYNNKKNQSVSTYPCYIGISRRNISFA